MQVQEDEKDEEDEEAAKGEEGEMAADADVEEGAEVQTNKALPL